MNGESHFFRTHDGTRLHFIRWGKPGAIPLVLLHGLRAYGRTWERLVEHLSDRFCCYALDQRGRGLSDWADSATYRTEVYVSDVEALVDHLGLKRFILIGHSMGGANALEYARRNPGRLIGMVVEDIGPGSSFSGDGAERIQREMRNTPLTFKNWDEARAFWVRSRPGLTDEAIRSRMVNSMIETPDGIQWRHDQAGIAKARLSIPPTDLWPAVRSLDCPALFVRGGESDFLSAAIAGEMKAVSDQIRFIEIANASHYVHDDRSEAFNRVVDGFLAELTDSRQ